MSDAEAERRRMKRRMLEEQLRLLDEDEYNARTSISNNTPVTASGSYPPQWAAITSSTTTSTNHHNPASSSSSSSTNTYGQSSRIASMYNPEQKQNPATTNTTTRNPAGSSSAWSPNLSSNYHHQQQQQQQHQSYQAQLSSGNGSNRPTSQSRSHQHPHAQQQAQPQQNVQYQHHTYPSQPNTYGSSSTSAPHSFRDLDRSSAGPSSSLPPQFSTALPTPQSSTLGASQTVPLPSEMQLHDWLRDCMGQPDGLDTNWRINGKRVDMYKLLSSVIRAGGSTEVSSRGWWYMLAKLLNLADDITPQTIKSSIAKQLQELFLQMLGGLEILWDKTKGTKEREALPRTRENSNLSESSTLPTPVTATMPSGGIYGQRQGSTSRREIDSPLHQQQQQQHHQQHHYVDPSKLTLPSKAQRTASNSQSTRIPENSSNSRQQGLAASRYPNSIQTTNSETNDSRFSPSSVFARPASASSSHAQQSPIVPSQLPIHQPTPFHPPPHRLPDLLTTPDEDTSRRNTTATSTSSQSKTQTLAPAQSGSKDRVPSPSQHSSRIVQLRFANKSLGEYQVPDVNSFQALVTSNILPLPQIEHDSNVMKMTWSSDPIIHYSKRCHELGHSVRKLKAGHPSRQISPEELVFWAKLLVIMAGNPSVIPPPVEDRPQSNPPPTIPPPQPSTTNNNIGPIGSFTNPAPLIPSSDSSHGVELHNTTSTHGSQPDASGSNINAASSKSKKRSRKSGDDLTATNGAGTATAPKKRGRKPAGSNANQPTPSTHPSDPEAHSQPDTSSQYHSVRQILGFSQPAFPLHTESQAGPPLQPLQSDAHESQGSASATQSQMDQASAALSSIEPKRPTFAKRGRPKGSKTVKRKAKPNPNGDQANQPQANDVENTVLVPASQPDYNIYSQPDPPAHSANPVSSFEGLFQAEQESTYSPQFTIGQQNDASEAGPSSSAPVASQNTNLMPFSADDQATSSQTTENGNSNGKDNSSKRLLTEEQRAQKAAIAKIRYQLMKEAQGILTPPAKYKKTSFNPHSDGGVIPLVQDLSPRKRIDLSTPNQSSSAKLRSQDSPFTVFLNTTKKESGLSNELASSSYNPNPPSGPLSSQNKVEKRQKKKQKVSHNQAQPDAGQPPLPSTLHDATLLNSDDIVFDPSITQDDGYEPSPAQVQELARALVESIGPIPDGDVPVDTTEVIEVDGAGEVDLDIEHPPTSQRRRGKANRKSKSNIKTKNNSKTSSPAASKKTASEPTQSDTPTRTRGGPTTKASNRSNTVGPSSRFVTPKRKSILVVELPSSRKTARVKFDTEPAPEPEPEAEAEVEVEDPEPEIPNEEKEPSPEYQPSLESEGQDEIEDGPMIISALEIDDEDVDELEDEADNSSEVEVEIKKPKIVKKKKKQASLLPIDRAKVVIPISRRRREELISRGHYDAFRDDDSEDDTLLRRRAHVSLRPVKLTVQRGSRTIRPSSPEPIPLRFMFRPGPALLEPFASILTEQSLINRLNEFACLWKGCDSVLGSEVLLKKHIQFRGHVKQGKEDVTTERWSWNTRKTTEREVVRGKWFYRCHWKGCEEPCFPSESDLMQHLTARHVSKDLKCPYENCELTSLNISHLSRHVTKTHDLPDDEPVPLADLSVRLIPTPPPAEPLTETARTDELTTQKVIGSVHRSAFYSAKVKEKVATHCFAGPDPIIHVRHPPHMLEIIDDDDDIIDSTGKTKPANKDKGKGKDKSKKKRLQVVVEIPKSKKRKMTEQEKQDRVLRMMNCIENQTQSISVSNDGQLPSDPHQPLEDDDNGLSSPTLAYESAPTPWIETDALMIEDELVLGAPTPAPFPSYWNDQDDDDDDDDDNNDAGRSGNRREEEDDLILSFFGLPNVNLNDDERDEDEANAELGEEGDEEQDVVVESPTEDRVQQASSSTQQEASVPATEIRRPSYIPVRRPTALFSPAVSTPIINNIENQFPFPARSASISFAQIQPINTGVANSPLRFGFAERFMVAPEIGLPTPTTANEVVPPSMPTTETDQPITPNTSLLSGQEDRYSALEEAIQSTFVNDGVEPSDNHISSNQHGNHDSNQEEDENVIRLNDVQVEML